MSFEERLLTELKAEVAVRAAREPAHPRTFMGRRLLAGAVLGVACALAAIVAPAVTGSGPAAYAVARNADGSITVTIKEMRDAGELEQTLAENGAHTDITYLPQRKRCSGDGRGVNVDPPPPPKTVGRPFRRYAIPIGKPSGEPAHRAIEWAPSDAHNVFKIFPMYIKPGQTLVLELGESHTTKLWKLGTYLISGPVKPCVLENDPYWN